MISFLQQPPTLISENLSNATVISGNTVEVTPDDLGAVLILAYLNAAPLLLQLLLLFVQKMPAMLEGDAGAADGAPNGAPVAVVQAPSWCGNIHACCLLCRAAGPFGPDRRHPARKERLKHLFGLQKFGASRGVLEVLRRPSHVQSPELGMGRRRMFRAKTQVQSLDVWKEPQSFATCETADLFHGLSSTRITYWRPERQTCRSVSLEISLPSEACVLVLALRRAQHISTPDNSTCVVLRKPFAADGGLEFRLRDGKRGLPVPFENPALSPKMQP